MTYFGRYLRQVVPKSDEIRALALSETLEMSKRVDTFEEIGLSLTILTLENIEPCVRLETDFLEISEVNSAKKLYLHSLLASDTHRHDDEECAWF